jgi:hypothetical protein
MGPLKSQNSVTIILMAEGTLLNFLVLDDDMLPLHALIFACRFIVVHPCFIACENPFAGKPLLRNIVIKIVYTFPCMPVCAHL